MAVALGFAAGSWAAGAAAPPPSGSVTFEGKTWNPVDAIAYVDGEGDEAETVLVFSSVAFDRRDFARDRVIDDADLTWHWSSNPTAYGYRVKVKADPAEQLNVDNIYDGGSSSGTYIERPRTLRIAGGKAPRISGSLAQPDGGTDYALKFDVPVEGEVAPSVEYLPEDGGEPGKVVTEFMDARTNDQYARMAGMLHPRREALIAADKPVSSRFFRWAQRGTQCRKLIGFTGGYVYGDEALVAHACDYGDERELRGVTLLYREDGAWRVVAFLPENIYE